MQAFAFQSPLALRPHSHQPPACEILPQIALSVLCVDVALLTSCLSNSLNSQFGWKPSLLHGPWASPLPPPNVGPLPAVCLSQSLEAPDGQDQLPFLQSCLPSTRQGAGLKARRRTQRASGLTVSQGTAVFVPPQCSVGPEPPQRRAAVSGRQAGGQTWETLTTAPGEGMTKPSVGARKRSSAQNGKK